MVSEKISNNKDEICIKLEKTRNEEKLNSNIKKNSKNKNKMN